MAEEARVVLVVVMAVTPGGRLVSHLLKSALRTDATAYMLSSAQKGELRQVGPSGSTHVLTRPQAWKIRGTLMIVRRSRSNSSSSARMAFTSAVEASPAATTAP